MCVPCLETHDIISKTRMRPQAPSTNGSTFAKPSASIDISANSGSSTNYGSSSSARSSAAPAATTYAVMYCKKGPKKRKAWSDGQLAATGQRVVLTDVATKTTQVADVAIMVSPLLVGQLALARLQPEHLQSYTLWTTGCRPTLCTRRSPTRRSGRSIRP